MTATAYRLKVDPVLRVVTTAEILADLGAVEPVTRRGAPAEKLRIGEAAALLGVSRKTLRRYALRGVLPVTFSHGGHMYFDPDDVREYLERQVVAADHTPDAMSPPRLTAESATAGLTSPGQSAVARPAVGGGTADRSVGSEEWPRRASATGGEVRSPGLPARSTSPTPVGVSDEGAPMSDERAPVDEPVDPPVDDGDEKAEEDKDEDGPYGHSVSHPI